MDGYLNICFCLSRDVCMMYVNLSSCLSISLLHLHCLRITGDVCKPVAMVTVEGVAIVTRSMK